MKRCKVILKSGAELNLVLPDAVVSNLLDALAARHFAAPPIGPTMTCSDEGLYLDLAEVSAVACEPCREHG